jgi:hypothetical protein
MLLRLRFITVNPALITSDNPGQKVCIIRGDLMKLLTDVDTMLFLTQLQIKGSKNQHIHPAA